MRKGRNERKCRGRQPCAGLCSLFSPPQAATLANEVGLTTSSQSKCMRKGRDERECRGPQPFAWGLGLCPGCSLLSPPQSATLANGVGLTASL